MFQRLIAHVICFVMIIMNVLPHSGYASERLATAELTERELFEKYPDAKVIRISPEEYKDLEKTLRERGYAQSDTIPLQLAQNNVGTEQTNSNKLELKDDCLERADEHAADGSLRVMVEITDDMLSVGNDSSSEMAAVVFVIVGTIVVIVWALYIFKFLYDISVGNSSCGHWSELTMVTSAAGTGVKQHARFAGLRYAMGFREGSLDAGISFELGQTDILLSEAGILELKGGYMFLGPVLRWRLSRGNNPNYFQMNFVAGTTKHEEVGLLAKANLGVLIGIGKSLQLGFNWGAMNIKLNDNQGLVAEHSQYYYLYGFSMGFNF